MPTFLRPTNIVRQYSIADNTVMNSLGELFYCNKGLELELPFIAMIDTTQTKNIIVDYGDFLDSITVPVIVMSYANIEECKQQLEIEMKLELLEGAH